VKILLQSKGVRQSDRS